MTTFLTFEVDPGADTLPLDIEVVVNYVKAMNYGLARLDSLPLSLRLIREIHGQLLTGVRGGDKSPGEFRMVGELDRRWRPATPARCHVHPATAPRDDGRPG